MLEIAYCNDQMTLVLLVIHCPKQAVDGRKSIGRRMPNVLLRTRPHSGSPSVLPAPYPPPGAFTRPLPDS